MALRIAEESDIPRILEIYSFYVENTPCSFEYVTPSPVEFRQRFRQITGKFPWLVWESEGKVLGYAYASAPFDRAAYQWCAEVSVYLDPDARRKGIGSLLYQAIESILTHQGYQTVYAVITSVNRDSLEFHLAGGYSFLAEFPRCGFKNGSWYGIIWMQKVLKMVESPIESPISWQVIVQSDRNLQENLAKLTLS